MSTLAMVVPVYNEEKLLPTFMANVFGHVDQIIFVDGSAEGVSTDNTAELIQKYSANNIQYISGQYGRLKVWDKKQQIKAGLDKVECDYVWLSSVDMLYRGLEDIKKVLNNDLDAIYGNCIEFWIDVKHIRKVADTYIKSYCMVCKKEYARHYILGMNDDIAIDHEIMYLSNTIMYHYGWVRPFDQQIRKHIRNVLTGGWGEIGYKLLQKGTKSLEAWAIYHVLKYRETPCIATITNIKYWEDMECYEGLEQYASEYERRTRQDFYSSIMSKLPHELLGV